MMANTFTVEVEALDDPTRNPDGLDLPASVKSKACSNESTKETPLPSLKDKSSPKPVPRYKANHPLQVFRRFTKGRSKDTMGSSDSICQNKILVDQVFKNIEEKILKEGERSFRPLVLRDTIRNLKRLEGNT